MPKSGLRKSFPYKMIKFLRIFQDPLKTIFTILILLLPPLLLKQNVIVQSKELGVTTQLIDQRSLQFQFIKENNYRPTYFAEVTDRQDVLDKPVPVSDLRSRTIEDLFGISTSIVRYQICFEHDLSIQKNKIEYEINDQVDAILSVSDDEGFGPTSIDVPSQECRELPIEIASKIGSGARMHYQFYTKETLFNNLRNMNLVAPDRSDLKIYYSDVVFEKVKIYAKPVNQHLWDLVLTGLFLIPWFGFVRNMQYWISGGTD